MAKRCVTDANIWIDLDHGGLLGRVFELGYELVIPDLVYAELETPDTALLDSLGLQVQGLTGAQLDVLTGELARRYGRPSLRDLAALLLAREESMMLLTGDGALRKAACAEGVEVHGVLWVLDEMVVQHVQAPPEAARSLHLITRAGARLPLAEVEARLLRWGGFHPNE